MATTEKLQRCDSRRYAETAIMRPFIADLTIAAQTARSLGRCGQAGAGRLSLAFLGRIPGGFRNFRESAKGSRGVLGANLYARMTRASVADGRRNYASIAGWADVGRRASQADGRVCVERGWPAPKEVGRKRSIHSRCLPRIGLFFDDCTCNRRPAGEVYPADACWCAQPARTVPRGPIARRGRPGSPRPC